jgi:hypothetical protein
MNKDTMAILVFELGNLQVFHYPTMQEWASHTVPIKVYWQRKDDTSKAWGPFDSIYAAVSHYDKILALEKSFNTVTTENLIYVDFKAKKRIK